MPLNYNTHVRNDEHVSSSDDASSSEELVPPPAGFLKTVRAEVDPNIALKDVMKTWDSVQGDQAQRAALCIQKMKNDRKPKPAKAATQPSRPLFESESDSDIEIMSSSKKNSQAAPARPKDKAKASASAAKDKGKGKAKEVIDLGSSSDEYARPSAALKRKAKAQDAVNENASPRPGPSTFKVPKVPAPRASSSRKTLDLDNDTSIEIVNAPVKPLNPSTKRKTSNGQTQDDEPVYLPDFPGAPKQKIARTDNAPIAGPSKAASPEKEQRDPLAQLTDIFPDLDLVYAAALLVQDAFKDKPDAMNLIAEYIFSLNNEYPKAPIPASKKGKGKAVVPDWVSPGKKRKHDEIEGEDEEITPDKAIDAEGPLWLQTGKRAPRSKEYSTFAVNKLCDDWPTIPKTSIRAALKNNDQFYATTFFELKKGLAARKYKKLEHVRPTKTTTTRFDADLHAEQKWVAAKHADEERIQAVIAARAAKIKAVQDAKDAKEKAEKDRLEAEDAAAEAKGEFIECGCCFTEHPWRLIVQCPEMHLFCMDCARRGCEEVIGNRKIDVQCMDGSGCSELFPDSELQRFLKPESFALLERIRQEKELALANLANLEECPFCNFALIIEDPNERLFECQKEDCGKVSCRQCKKENHLPKTCKEMDQDAKLNQLHNVAEKMTEALLRKCPGCKQPFVKEYGCNKMTCPACNTLSCFCCGKKIKGYAHFRDGAGNQIPAPPGAAESSAGCLLHDDTEERLRREIEAAQKKAAAEAKLANPAIDDNDVSQYNLAPAPTAPARPNHAMPRPAQPRRRPGQLRRPAPQMIFPQAIQRPRLEQIQLNIDAIRNELAQYQNIMADPNAYGRYIGNWNAAVQRLQAAQRQLAEEQMRAAPGLPAGNHVAPPPPAAWVAEQQRAALALQRRLGNHF